MFRIALLSLLVAAAHAADFLGTADIEHQLRQLQFEDFDLDAFQFNFAGVNFNAQTAQDLCPSQWSATFGCLATKCPNALDVCPDLTAAIPEDNVGAIPTEMPVEGETVAPTEAEGETVAPTEAEGETMAPTGEMVTNTTMRVRFLEDEEVPDCETLDEAFCNFTTGEDGVDLSECCLTECIPELQELLTCVILQQTGEDRSDCTVPDCPTPAPVDGGEDDGTTAPASAGSLVVFSKMAAVVASVLAFAVL